MPTIRHAATALSAAALIALAPVARAQEPGAETVLATVNGVKITLGHVVVAVQGLPQQYRQMPDDALYEGVLEQLIQQTALAQSVEDPTTVTVLTIENQTSGLLAGEALGKVAEAAVTDDALQAAYDETYAEAEPSREYNASHILVETEEEAQALLAELEGGADFATLAQENSTGPSGPNGGSLGWFEPAMMVAPFADAVSEMEPGDVAGPVQTQFGWHVIRLNETRMTSAPPLEEVRGELVQQVERAAIDAHVSAVLDDADVTRAEVEVDPALIRDLGLVSE